MAPRVTVVIATHNVAAIVGDALRSIRENSGGVPVEIVVQDGLSTDQTLDVVAGFPEVAVESAPDSGIYNAFNRAVVRARGDWVLFLGADDRLLPGFASAAAQLTEHGTIYYGDVIRVPSNVRVGGEFRRWRILRQNLPHQAVFYPRALFADVQYDESYVALADWAFNIRAFFSPRRFQYLPELVCQYSDLGFSSSFIDEPFHRDRRTLERLAPRHVRWPYWAARRARRLLGLRGEAGATEPPRRP